MKKLLRMIEYIIAMLPLIMFIGGGFVTVGALESESWAVAGIGAIVALIGGAIVVYYTNTYNYN